MIRIITTEDGSHSLYDEELNETYHSTKGAIGESMHVFIRQGLNHWLFQNKVSDIRILEVGLGTGLNVFLTAQFSEALNLDIHVTSLEPFPIKKEIYENLNYYGSEIERTLVLKIHDSPWDESIQLTSTFSLFKSPKKLEEYSTQETFEIVYFDAFAPGKQPEVWSLDNLKKCFELLTAGGVLTTYCAQSQFKRHLAEVGFEVETLQGAMGKKEMVRGVKPH